MSEESISHERAQFLIWNRFRALEESECLPLACTLGRYLHAPLSATAAVPAFDNAAVDGYALMRATIKEAGGRPVRISGRIAAGEMVLPLTKGAACRVFTGAPIPDGADIIVMDEDIDGLGEDSGAMWICIPPQVATGGSNIRSRGEDLEKGDIAIGNEVRLRPQDLAAAASLGVDRLTCRRRVRVAVFSTGRELREISDCSLQSVASIPDSNRTLLFGLLERLPVEVHDGGILPDDPATMAAALESVAHKHDLVITSGGAGYGEEDHLLSVLEELGEILFRRVSIKPGRPLSLGVLPSGKLGGECAWMVLPGNPVAVMVCFLIYVRPLLARLGGAGVLQAERYLLPACFSMKKKTGRREFQRGILLREEGRLQVERFTEQGSGILRSLRMADGLIELGEDVSRVTEGDSVWYLPFSGMGIDN